MHFEAVFVALFAIASAVALAACWLKIPYTVALVVAGLVLGAVHAVEPPHLTKELLYAIFLPGLVFEAAFHLDFQKFWQNKLAIHSLAVPGVAAAIGLTAILLQPVVHALHLADGFTMQHALVFSALIAATDPIAVVALFKTLGAPKRLTVLVEGESLLNDGTAVVLFTLTLGLVGLLIVLQDFIADLYGMAVGGDGSARESLVPGLIGFVLVLDTPFFARTDAAGRFRLDGLPEGDGELVVFHDRGAPLKQQVTVTKGSVIHLKLDLNKRRVPAHTNKFGKPYARTPNANY